MANTTFSGTAPTTSEATPLLRGVSTHHEDAQPSSQAEESSSAGSKERQIGMVTAFFMIFNQMIGTGIFATPSTVLELSGSVGMALYMWIVGASIALAGMWVYVIWGTAIPKNGGDKNYLEYLFPRPKYLISSIYSGIAIMLSSASGNAIVFGEYLLRAANHHNPSPWTQRLVGFTAIVFTVVLHGTRLRYGVYVQNILGTFKIIVLMIVIFSGAAALGGYLQIERPDNFTHIFEGTTASASSISLSLYKVIFSFVGFANVNSALSEVRNPKRTLRIVGPLAVASVATLYLLANLSYFAASPKAEIIKSRELVAALLFKNVWDANPERVLSVFVALSALGNVMATMFACGRIIRELGREGIIPCSQFFASSLPYGTPLAGIGLHGAACTLIIFAFPPGDAYTFVVNMVYVLSIIYMTVALGVIYLYFRPAPHWPHQGPVAVASAACFGAATIFLVLAPLARPPPGKEPYDHIPYWSHVAAGWGLCVLGAVYWAVWARLLPWVGGYAVERAAVVGRDGTSRWVFKRVKVE